MTIKVIIKGKEVRMTRKEFLRRFGDRKKGQIITKDMDERCPN
ncbi:hypothetical protein [Oceanispirochaeta crateris]|nr:hypothetical protein [Oceanispirochaeta crateris]